MAQFGVLVTWREVTGTEPTLKLLQDRLAQFRLEPVLVAFSRFAAVLQTWLNEPSFGVAERYARQFLPNYYPAIRKICEEEGAHVIFARISILFVLKTACSVCSDEGRDIRTPADVEQLLSACLLANDLLLERLPTRQDTQLEKAANLLPFTNYVPQDTYPTDLARNLLLIEDLAPQLFGRHDYIDLTEAFRNATGLTPRQFCELTLATSTRFITNVDAQLQNPDTAFLLTPTFFQHSAVPNADVATFLARLHTTVNALREEAGRDSGLGSDFLLFQRRPLVEITGPLYVCPDPGFLLDKGGPGLYWTLHEATPVQRRHSLLTYWSSLVERYVHWLFEQTYQGRGRFQASPHFGNGDEAGDALLREGSTLVVFEVKASILTVQAKYGFSPDILMRELQQKAINGEDGERKGVAQLHHNITRWLTGDDIAGQDRLGIKTIQPILVFLDPAFTSPYLNSIYNQSFNSADLRRAYRCRVTPLFSITVDDLENILPFTNQHYMSDILESYYRTNRWMAGSLSQGRIPLLDGAKPSKDLVRERFHEFADRLEERFFPKEKSDGQPE